MTEQEWLTCTDPMILLRHVGVKQDDPKVLLLILACMARIEYLLPDHGQLWMETAWAVALGDSCEELELDLKQAKIPRSAGFRTHVLDGVSSPFCSLRSRRTVPI